MIWPEKDKTVSSSLIRLQVGEATIPFRSEVKRHRLTPPHTAYLRVAEGCNHACTFCAIPGFRCYVIAAQLHANGSPCDGGGCLEGSSGPLLHKLSGLAEANSGQSRGRESSTKPGSW